MKKKRNIKIKSKHLIVIMSLVCISLMLLTFTAKLPTGPVKRVAGYIIVPFQNGLNEVGNLLSGVQDGFQKKSRLVKENKKLQEKVEELTTENSQLIQNQYELERLQKLYDLDQQYAEYDKVAAEVISKDPGNWYDTFVINKGSDDGIKKDMNVITIGGLVGIVTETGSNWSTVRSIIDDSSNVSAQVATTSDTCTVTGNLKLMDSGKLGFIQLRDEEGKVQVGDKIVTSQISDKFLKGILIGYISELERSNHLTYTGTLIPQWILHIYRRFL